MISNLYPGSLTRKYLSLFRMKFIAGLQYRAAAFAGIITQFAWGFLEILLYNTLYHTNSAAFPMSFSALSSYIWLQEAFIILFLYLGLEKDILTSISDGSIAYELCRPISIYPMWFIRTMAQRLSRVVLRCVPILILAFFLPQPYKLTLPADGITAFWFLISLLLGFLLSVSFNMLIYTMTFYTISSLGSIYVISGIVEFLSGSIIPIPFFPKGIRQVLELLPFASMQNVPFRIYSGDISGFHLYQRVGLQLFWLLLLFSVGICLARRALKRIVIQGG